MESSGELLYTAPDRLEKRTLKPRPESLLIEGGSLTVERGKRRMVLRLQDYPELVAFTESIRGTLAGDMVALRRVYNLDLEGSEERWTLTLRPIETKMLEVVQRKPSHSTIQLVITISALVAKHSTCYKLARTTWRWDSVRRTRKQTEATR